MNSHKLKEILRICDRYTVLRDGQLAGTGEISEIDEEGLTKLMEGKSLEAVRYSRANELDRPSLEVRGLRREKWFQNIHFTLKNGEILGFTGLAGDGRTELFEAIFGCLPYSGDVLVEGRLQKLRHPSQALQAGIGLVPKNRKENAIIKDMSILENMSMTTLPHFQHGLFIDTQKERAAFEWYRDMLSIKVTNLMLPIVSLSGGNQQKGVLAKWLHAAPKILIFDNPTQGIDVGAKSEIYQVISDLAGRGTSIIILSSELPEIMKLCDRVIVMFQGEVTAALSHEEMDEETIMLYATGVKRKELAI